MITILLIEDEPNQRTLFRMELEDEGYRPILASNGLDGLRKSQTEQPDLVVLDLVMPGMDGAEVLKYLKRSNPELPVIFYSGDEEFLVKTMAEVADGYLLKCSNMDLLKREIRRVLIQKTGVKAL